MKLTSIVMTYIISNLYKKEKLEWLIGVEKSVSFIFKFSKINIIHVIRTQ